MMKDSQTLTNLVNSAKKNQEEFENSLKEIHLQSAKSIEAELTKIYAKEMKEINKNILNMTSNIRESLKEYTINGAFLLMILIGICLGFLIMSYLYKKDTNYYEREIATLKAWQIPTQFQNSYTTENGKEIRAILITPNKIKEIQLKDGTRAYYYQLNY